MDRGIRYPMELSIQEIKYDPVGEYLGMTCGEYGWSLDAIVRAGCELISSNETLVLPEKWYIEGCTELVKLLKELGSTIVGNSTTAGYYSTDNMKSWAYAYIGQLDGYTPITVKHLRNYLESQNTQSINQTTETMQTTEAKQERITATITTDNRIVVQKDDRVTLNVPLIKETITTRVVKLQSVSFDKKDKAKETPIVTTVEREVSVSVIADENGYIYTGYVVKNPTDKKVSPELGKEIARHRAVNPKTNLTPHETITVGLLSKEVLKGIAAQIFTKLSKGSIQLKGVK